MGQILFEEREWKLENTTTIGLSKKKKEEKFTTLSTRLSPCQFKLFLPFLSLALFMVMEKQFQRCKIGLQTLRNMEEAKGTGRKEGGE